VAAGSAAAQQVAAQLQRDLRSSVEVVSRCHLDLPVVVKVPPHLDDGTPFPTLFWLTCPLAAKRIGRLEAAGGVKRMESKAEADPAFGARLDRAHSRYASARDALADPARSAQPGGGVGGADRGVKCLHAHYADARAGNDNPVGEVVAAWIEPLDCELPCVLGAVRNPEWRPRP
jgi:hypothetical protein